MSAEVRALEATLRVGGGDERIARQHKQGKLTARERIAGLCDPETRFLEVGLLVAYDQYDGQAPAAGVVTGIGMIHGREVVIVANDATVKAGSWWPETIKKMLRAQEIAMRCRIPIIYLVDSAGVNLPYQEGVFPGQYGAARLFYYNSIMRRYLRIPQIAAVMGPCIAGGAYLPALSDVILMVEGTSFMGLGGPNLVKGATGQVIDGETLGGARTHTEVSAVAHYAVADDPACLAKIRELVARLPRDGAGPPRFEDTADAPTALIVPLHRVTKPPRRRRASRRRLNRTPVRSASRRPSHVVRHAQRAWGDPRRRRARRVPGAARQGDDLRRWRASMGCPSASSPTSAA